MLRTTKTKNGGMKIAERITILYAGVFSLTIIIISIIILQNASTFNQNIVKEELKKTRDAVEEYIQDGNAVTEDNISDLLANRYVELMISNVDTGERVSSSVGMAPPFLDINRSEGRPPDWAGPRMEDEPKEKDVLQENAQGGAPEADKGKNILGFRENMEKYSLQSFRGSDFIYLENVLNADSGRYHIVLYKMLGDDASYMRSFALRMVAINIIGIFIAFLIGKYISRIMLEPVKRIRKTAEKISIEDLSRRIELAGPDDEMKELTITFNSMIDRLEEAFKRQSQFVSDASHELRTPISVIQGYAKLINRWGKSDPVVLQESIDSVISETEHMSNLVKSLLFLAKSDTNSIHLQRMPVRLDELTADVVKDLCVTEPDRNIVYEDFEPLEIYADPDAIKQLLWSHTDNAMKYTKPGGTITYRVFKDGELACVSIGDDGAGIGEEDLNKIFDRFYRADKSRNKEIPGSGLGLSIATWIAQSNGGSISVSSILGEGSVFTDRFKIYKPKEDGKKNVD